MTMALWPQLSAAESRRGPARGHYKVSGFSWRQYQTSGVTLGAHLALHRTLCHLRQGVQLDALLDQAQRRSREVHRQAEASVQFKRKLLHCARLLGIASELDQRLCVHHSAPTRKKERAPLILARFLPAPQTDGTACADSTNFCNLHDLYCGSKDNCPHVK